MNWSLFCVVYLIVVTVTMGVFIVAALVTGFNEIAHILIVAILGMIVAIPEALFFSKKVGSITGNEA
ncbi:MULTISPECIES: hypothetical protein [Psychrobacter]|uniref:Uncharacterized protein n=1 Tax=Psychrobacter alimentarius TaxID=261164 RepID=A0ABN4N2B1_9GAMM|nr:MULTISPECIES: hypothetical protein [Psychrobacter]AMT96496.1 hypothetical protein A3K91_0878 [Psychrobacter alimentarius]QCB31115.1 hypothetical protein E5677_08990 [Psychrobacter sp. PAMC27889]